MDDKELEETLEKTVTFKVGDMMTYGVMSEDGNELLATITGFGLEIRFNMRLINSLADAEATANAMADVFYQALMEQLLAEKAEVVKQAAPKRLFLAKENLSGPKDRLRAFVKKMKDNETPDSALPVEVIQDAERPLTAKGRGVL